MYVLYGAGCGIEVWLCYRYRMRNKYQSIDRQLATGLVSMIVDAYSVIDMYPQHRLG